MMRGTGILSPLALTKQRPPVVHETEAPFDDVRDHSGHGAFCPLPPNNDHPDADMDEDCVVVEDKDIVKTGLDEDVELEAMFYLPKWDSAPSFIPKLFPAKQTDENLRIILANVAELLSRSPPPLTLDSEASLCDPVPADTAVPSLPPSPRRMEEGGGPGQPFQVSFTLDIDDDEPMSDVDDSSPRADSDETPMAREDVKVCHVLPHEQPQQPLLPSSVPDPEPLASEGDGVANSPNWDEVFDCEVSNDYAGIREDCVNEEVGDEILNDSKEEQVGDRAEENKETKSCEPRNEERRGLMDSHFPNRHHPPHPELSAEEQCRPRMDESMDLFGDDEAFLQMTIPQILTPEDCVTPNKSPKDIPNDSLQTFTPMNATNTVQSHDLAHRSNTKHRRLTLHPKQILQATNTHNTALYSEPKLENAAETNQDIWETNTEHLLTDRTVSHCESPTMQHNPESFDSSHDYFSVNFDLGYSLEDSGEEAEAETVPAPGVSVSPGPEKQRVSSVSSPAVSHPSTPRYSFHRPRPALRSTESKSSTPQTLSGPGRRNVTSPLTSPLVSKRGILTSPIASPGGVRAIVPGSCAPHTPTTPFSLKRRRREGRTPGPEREAVAKSSFSGECDVDSEEEIVVHKRRHQSRANPLSSPDVVSER